MNLGKYGRNKGWGVLALICFLYGIGVPITAALASESFAANWAWYGSLICGALFLALMVVPFLLWAFGPKRVAQPTPTKVG